MGAEEEEKVRSNFNGSPGSFGIVHCHGRGNPAARIGRWPITLIENQDGPDFPPDRGGIDATVVNNVVMVGGRHEDRRGGRASLPERIQRNRQVD